MASHVVVADSAVPGAVGVTLINVFEVAISCWRAGRTISGRCTLNRRAFLTATAMAPGLGLVKPVTAAAELPKGTITRVRIYRPPNLNPLFNQSNMVVTVETDFGITGIGEGGSKDTLEQV